MTIDLRGWSRGGLRTGRARLTSPSLHLPESCDRNTLGTVRGDTIASWPRASGGKLEWNCGVIEAWCSWRSVWVTDMTKGTEIKGLFLEF